MFDGSISPDAMSVRKEDEPDGEALSLDKVPGVNPKGPRCSSISGRSGRLG